MTIEIIKPGLLTSVQDLGRKGYFHLGIPLSGAMDQFACRCANLLVGNEQGEAVLEAVFMGPEIKINRDGFIAVTGAKMQPLLDGVEQQTWTSIPVSAGQVLSFRRLMTGARIYIAFSGGIDVPVVLGSRSTYTLGALGGFEGRGLKPGDKLPLGKGKDTLEPRHLPVSLRRESTDVLRVVPGLYWHRITEQAGQDFFAANWTVASESDRIGYRFNGEMQLDFIEREAPFGAGSDPSNIVDACYPYGSIQVPAGKEPIILHRDAVSGGGYFMIGTVISADMDLIGQMQPHTQVKFEQVTLEEALRIRRSQAFQEQQALEFIVEGK